jgi:hypothetical protein
MNLAQFVRAARVIQNPLRGCGFTGIDMSRDADVPHPFERNISSHKNRKPKTLFSRR